MTIERQECPLCAAGCKLIMNFADVSYANLDDRLLGLDAVPRQVICTACGHIRTGQVRDLDVSWDTGKIEFGELTYD